MSNQDSAISLLFHELNRRLREIDWINQPYLQMMMDTKDEWLKYQEELKSIPHRLSIGELDPPKIINGTLHFSGWPTTQPSDSESSWDKMRHFSERECPEISEKKIK